jgi:diguanylate cyclase
MIMTAYDPSLHSDKKGFFGWLNRVRAGPGDLTDLAALAEYLRIVAPGSRADMLGNIAEFLGKYDLDVCGVTLGVAHDYVSGTDPLLMRLIHERDMIGQEVTVDWLKKLRGQHKEDAEANEIHRAFEKLEQQLVEFGVTAAAARRATQEYGTSLEGHAEQLSATPADVAVSVSEVLGVVRGMIERTSDMEKEMIRSEEQSETLRRNLEAALREAEEDFLTGLPNRRAFEKTYENEYRDARHAKEQLVIGVCDIDHFKRINDAHGHETGDRVLRAVARNLSGISSECCYIARHGGEEFAVLFRGKSLDQARQLDEVRVELADRRMINRATKTTIGNVTFSAGIAEVFSYPDRRAAMKAADGALYQAKGLGRNQIVVA